MASASTPQLGRVRYGPGVRSSMSLRLGLIAPALAVSVVAAAGVIASEPSVRIAAGPVLGHVGPTEARVWVQVEPAGSEETIRLVLEVKGEGEEEWRVARRWDGRTRLGIAATDTRFATTLEVDGLRPAWRYEYRIATDEGPLSGQDDQTFRTAPAPGSSAPLRVAFGSCASHWGPEPGQPIFEAVAAAEPDLMLMLGDNLYFDYEGREWAHPELMWARYENARRVESFAGMARRIPTYAIWDDHDYGPNDSDKLYPLKDLSLHIFRTFWANPTYGTDGTRGVWYRMRWGEVEFFMLDNRFHRDPNEAPPTEHKTMWGTAQRAWLADVLAESDATFKLVVSSNQVLARYHSWESANDYPADRRWLIGLIREREISGVLLLSGDRHIGEILRWERPEAPYTLYELTSSPLAAGIATDVRPDEAVAERLPGSLVEERNFGFLEFRFDSGAMGGGTVVFEHRDVEGRPVGRRLELDAEELRP